MAYHIDVFITRFPTKWNLTKSQEELIKEFRENQIASLLSCNKTDMGEVKHPESGLSPMSNVPLPDMEKENDAMDSDMESVKSASTKLPRPKTRSRSKKENVLMDINWGCIRNDIYWRK